jgi:hypothetical protein
MIAAQVVRMIGEYGASVIGLGQPGALQHGAHRAIEHEDTLLQDVGEDAETRGARREWIGQVQLLSSLFSVAASCGNRHEYRDP